MKLSWAAMSLALATSTSAVTNEWVKPSSGNWEEPYWSVGTLPAVTQEAVALRNPGWKAVAISANTTANYPTSLRVNNLIIDAATDSANQLLLNWAGHNVPFVVRSNLFIGTHGSLVGHFSALRAANAEIQGFAAFSDSANATFDKTTLSWDGALNLNDATFTCSNLAFFGGSVTQSMGVAVISRLGQEARLYVRPPNNVYALSGGILYSGNAGIGYYGLGGSEQFRFYQSGGVHSNTTMTLSGGQRRYRLIDHAGYYFLSGGRLVSEQMDVHAGVMDQSGGTNRTRELDIKYGGYYTLNSGRLVTSNTTLSTVDSLGRGIAQNGGSHSVENRLTLEKQAGYRLSAGTLSARVIEIKTEAALALTGGAVFNSGKVVLRRGHISVTGVPQQLGKLQVLELTEPGWVNAPSTIDMSSGNVPTLLRFQDSRDVSWSGELHIRNWSTHHAGNGSDRIFVGTSSQALTASQLNRVIFIRPSGLPSDYSGALTASGELVPGAVHDYDYVVTNGTVTITRYTGPGGNITVPSTIEGLPVRVIGNSAFNPDFNHITSLKSITLPDTVTDIGERAFHYCKGLTNINLGNGVIRIGDYAFSDCDNIPFITIPASVRDIGFAVFELCDSFVAINVHPDNLVYSSLDGVLFNKTQTRLIQFPWRKGGAYAVPATIRSIEYAAFASCYYLSSVILSASVTNIGDYAFLYCRGLTNITIPEGLRTIGDWAFSYCGLTSINLPDSLTSIGDSAFHQSSLVRAEIGRGIMSFNAYHFFGVCWELAGVYFRGHAPQVLGDGDFDADSTPNVRVYYLPGTVGWGATFAGRPTALWQPLILDFGPSFGVRSNRFGFVISWAKNARVVVEASSNLKNSSWVPISTNILTTGSSYFSDPRWTSHANRFYRLRAQ